MRYFPSLIIGAVVAGVAQAAPHERAASGLNTAAIAAGKLYFGSATDNPELTDTAYVNELSNTGDWGQTTPGNSMKACTNSTRCYRRLVLTFYSGMQLSLLKTHSHILEETRSPTSPQKMDRSSDATT